jgi:small subunit ribosomal protein S20
LLARRGVRRASLATENEVLKLGEAGGKSAPLFMALDTAQTVLFTVIQQKHPGPVTACVLPREEAFTVANTPSAKKRIKQNLKRRLRNRAVRSTIRSSVKTARAAVTEKTPQAAVAVLEAIRVLDRAVSRGIIHRNTAARKKSARPPIAS